MNEENEEIEYETPDQKAFGQRLEKFRKKYGLSFSDLARICVKYKYASRTTIYRVEKGIALDPVFQKAVPALEKTLREWMSANNFTAAENERDLDDLFKYEERIMSFKRTKLPSKAVKHFGLKNDPFDIDELPLDHEIFCNAELNEVAERIIDAVLYKRFLCVTGKVGDGKTTMKVRVQRELAALTNYKVVLIYPEFFFMREVTVTSIADSILQQFDIPVPRNKTARVKAIRHHLTQLEKNDYRIALMFDECHNLNKHVLSSLKNFWELTNGGYSRLLSIVLFGQPQFTSILREEKFYEIAERVDALEMPSITDSARDYLAHKFAVAGGNIDALFEPKALDKIIRVGKTPLQLGNIANMALIEAYNKDEHRVDLGMLKLPEAVGGIRAVRTAA